MAKQKSPLSEPDLASLNTLIRDCVETDEECQRCEKCNLDVSPERTKNAEQLETARKIKAAYFPNAT